MGHPAFRLKDAKKAQVTREDSILIKVTRERAQFHGNEELGSRASTAGKEEVHNS